VSTKFRREEFELYQVIFRRSVELMGGVAYTWPEESSPLIVLT
jgi:hypothetical protein